MKKQDRWNEILNIVKQQQEVSVEKLMGVFNVSAATIRRDLLEMEENGMIDRYHGGAKMNNSRLFEPPMLLKSNTNTEAKNMVGRYAASLVKDNQMIYIDAGSATYEMIDYISAKNITVVTIGIHHILKLLNKGINTIVLGGSIRSSTMAITGSLTLSELDKYYFDASFLGTNGIHEFSGLSATNEFEAAVKLKVIEHSNISYGLADHSKFGVICPCSYTTLDKIHLITDNSGPYKGKKLPHCVEVEGLFHK